MEPTLTRDDSWEPAIQFTTVTATADMNNHTQIIIITSIKRLFAKYTDLVVMPFIAVVGLVGNTLTGVILVKSGFRKSSLILLFALAVSDFALLLDPLSIPRILTYVSPIQRLWNLSPDSINICYNIYMTHNFISLVATRMTSLVTTFITLERIIAIYFPLRFSSLVTRQRTICAVILAACSALPAAVVMRFRYQLGIVYVEAYASWFGYISVDPNWQGSDMELYILIFGNYIMSTIPTIIVTVGCVLISVRISVTIRNRKTMAVSSRNTRSFARTKTLLMVCFVFSFTQICGLLISLPQLSNYDPTSFEYYVTFIYSKVVNTLFLFNSACNFFIYVLFNPKFRKLIVQNFFKSKPKQ